MLYFTIALFVNIILNLALAQIFCIRTEGVEFYAFFSVYGCYMSTGSFASNAIIHWMLLKRMEVKVIEDALVVKGKASAEKSLHPPLMMTVQR